MILLIAIGLVLGAGFVLWILCKLLKPKPRIPRTLMRPSPWDRHQTLAQIKPDEYVSPEVAELREIKRWLQANALFTFLRR